VHLSHASWLAWALRGVSLFIPQGQAVALVGHNGAGKTTLVKLLCRFYDPDRGVIRWDGVDVRDLDLAGLRDRISVVFQDFMTYELSAAENIAVGDLERAASREALTAAAQRAGLGGLADLAFLFPARRPPAAVGQTGRDYGLKAYKWPSFDPV
jgi:ATP-binding cassette, subfamily B, bacterial